MGFAPYRSGSLSDPEHDDIETLVMRFTGKRILPLGIDGADDQASQGRASTPAAAVKARHLSAAPALTSSTPSTTSSWSQETLALPVPETQNASRRAIAAGMRAHASAAPSFTSRVSRQLGGSLPSRLDLSDDDDGDRSSYASDGTNDGTSSVTARRRGSLKGKSSACKRNSKSVRRQARGSVRGSAKQQLSASASLSSMVSAGSTLTQEDAGDSNSSVASRTSLAKPRASLGSRKPTVKTTDLSHPRRKPASTLDDSPPPASDPASDSLQPDATDPTLAPPAPLQGLSRLTVPTLSSRAKMNTIVAPAPSTRPVFPKSHQLPAHLPHALLIPVKRANRPAKPPAFKARPDAGAHAGGANDPKSPMIEFIAFDASETVHAADTVSVMMAALEGRTSCAGTASRSQSTPGTQSFMETLPNDANE
ncbi:hypothetical protein BC831DRAFT_440367 [Entophlyctis helioformis]|nr:hypothetical protein BC831DRAFT_440367 [Entophlyctis helioformis]